MNAGPTHFILLFFFAKFLHSSLLPEKKPLFPFKFLHAMLVVTSMRNSSQLKKISPERTLAILGLKMGDLFITKKNDHNRPPVIGFLGDLEMSKGVTMVHKGTSYFLPVEEGTVGIYFRKNINSIQSSYWCKFHEVWINGKKCVIHEQFIHPIGKGAEKDE
jgi:hypothetical protein